MLQKHTPWIQWTKASLCCWQLQVLHLNVKESLLHGIKVHTCCLTWNSFPKQCNSQYWSWVAWHASVTVKNLVVLILLSKLLIYIRCQFFFMQQKLSHQYASVQRWDTRTRVHQHSVLGKTQYSYLVLKKILKLQINTGKKWKICTEFFRWLRADLEKLIITKYHNHFLSNAKHLCWNPHFLR